MKFVRTIPGYNHLWAVKEEGKETDELSMLFRQWSNFNYLLDFFFANLEDLKGFFKIEKVSGAIKLTATMQEREHTQKELDKLNACRDFLKQNGVFDQDSFIDFFEEG